MLIYIGSGSNGSNGSDEIVVAVVVVRCGRRCRCSEVLRQIDDPQSKLPRLHHQRYQPHRSTTQNTASLSTASASLSTHRDAKGSTRKFDVGSTIELWKHGDDAISCTVESTLGEGAHGLVLKVKYADRTCALKVKKFDKESSHRFLQLCDEASLTVDLNFPQSHPHVVGMDFVRSMDKTQSCSSSWSLSAAASATSKAAACTKVPGSRSLDGCCGSCTSLLSHSSTCIRRACSIM